MLTFRYGNNRQDDNNHDDDDDDDDNDDAAAADDDYDDKRSVIYLFTADCVRYVVGGTRIRTELSGHYDLVKQTFNNRLVYGQKCSQYALFAKTSTENTTSWVIGKGVGDDVNVYVKSRDSRAYPGMVASWLVWSRENESWVDDQDLFVRCVDTSTHKSCKSFIINSPDVPSSYHGPYVIDGFHNNRVKYRHVIGNYYLYFDNDVTCRRWVIGHVTGNVVMEVFSDVKSPFKINSRWRIVISGSFFSETYLHLHCLEYEEDKDSMFTCGKRQITSQMVPYILGADITYPGKWPFMVSYTRGDGEHKCGATLLAKKWLITTGHCVAHANLEQEEIKLGAFDLNDIRNETTQIVRIKSVHIHPLFSWVLHPFRLNHDVGLIELANDVTYTDHIQPVCLPAYEDHFPYTDVEPRSTKKLNTTYTDCHIVGWGKTDYNSGVGGKLQDMTISKVMPLSECFDIYYNNLSPGMRNATDVCLFGRTGGRICKGDSGSPFVCQKNGQWYLLGLGGWSLAECIDIYVFYPSVYTDVSVYRDWIFATIYGSD
ncbi:hypothetical protein LSH36_40g15086 [Paralvinella palmiformis]|uniref:Peptidase S1 domain-containing protein n=1 Tax=Paralvinella palmiformis TaxID=53620 RepID=A0AAD9K7W6_9ANNE|nr:hypothetical protein LSH36_40g15086 [Paralvinella palmiformis]